mmetsp:Transcript_23045/g.57036  ORF Transcript_23045/g.57036 Transcript_23045/m.57036 type:complete len:281 (+) Transcript_23045:954-1796(+)
MGAGGKVWIFTDMYQVDFVDARNHEAVDQFEHRLTRLIFGDANHQDMALGAPCAHHHQIGSVCTLGLGHSGCFLHAALETHVAVLDLGNVADQSNGIRNVYLDDVPGAVFRIHGNTERPDLVDEGQIVCVYLRVYRRDRLETRQPGFLLQLISETKCGRKSNLVQHLLQVSQHKHPPPRRAVQRLVFVFRFGFFKHIDNGLLRLGSGDVLAADDAREVGSTCFVFCFRIWRTSGSNVSPLPGGMHRCLNHLADHVCVETLLESQTVSHEVDVKHLLGNQT